MYVFFKGRRPVSQDGTSKMSKSAESDMSRINLLDTPDSIALKIKRAKTDAFEGLEADNPDRPEARNLLTIYALVTGQSMARPPPLFPSPAPPNPHKLTHTPTQQCIQERAFGRTRNCVEGEEGGWKRAPPHARVCVCKREGGEGGGRAHAFGA